MSTAVWVGNPTGNVAMINGFGGVLAAPIWNQYMKTASGSYCGDWAAPSTPFTGTAFFGPHAASGSASTIPTTGTATTQSATGTTQTTTGNTGATNGGTGVKPGGGNQYNNPTLYSSPPQAPPPGTANISPGGGGNGGGNGKGGGGKGH
jgi:penicillin-binding protein 1A